MPFNEINKIIMELPNFFIYFFPGFIFLEIRNHKLSKDMNKNKVIYLESMALSYILVEIFNKFISKKWLPLVLIIAIIIISYVYCYFNIEEKLLNLLKVNKNNDENYINDVFGNSEKWVYVYINKEQIIYFGKLSYHHNNINNNEKIIVISEYERYDYNFKKLAEVEINKKVLINFNEVTRIEFFDV